MRKELKERLIKEIVIESNHLLELIQWADQKDDSDMMKKVLSNLELKCLELREELGL
jgi:hypothetical protein